MRKIFAAPVLAAVVPLLLTGAGAVVAPAAAAAGQPGIRHAVPAGSHLGAASLPLTFEANQGQAPGGVRYIGQLPGVTVLFTGTGVTLELAAGTAGRQQPVTLAFLHASPRARITGAGREGVVSYFIGDDAARWRAGIPAFTQVVYHGLWPGVDAGFSAGDGTLRYWFTLAPGARVSEVQLGYTGARRLLIGRSGALAVSTAGGMLTDQAPASTQVAGGRRSPVASRYRLLGGTRLGFSVGRRSAGAALTIDPGLDYGTYLGGSVADSAFSVVSDAAGDLFVFGQTDSPDFPVTAGAYQRTMPAGAGDVLFVAKLNPSGTALIYSTFVGGNGTVGTSHGAIDSAGDAYVSAEANSTGGPSGFPVTRGAFRTIPFASATQGVVFKLNPTGSRLLYSTYLAPDMNQATNADTQWIAAVPGGSVIVGGMTDVDFAPTTAGAFEPNYPGGYQAPYVARLNSTGSGLIYGTYLGAPLTNQMTGTAPNPASCQMNGLTAGADGSAYIAAACMPGFPTTPGAYQATASHAGAGLLVKLAPDGRRLDYATYWGQSVNVNTGGDPAEWVMPNIAAVAVDKLGNAYIAADVHAESIPATAGAYQTGCTPNDPVYADMYPNCGGVAEFNPAGTRLLFSTYFGGNQNGNASNTSPTDLAIDASGHVYVVGFAGSGMIPTTAGAFQQTAEPTVLLPFFLAVFGHGTLLYSTYFGGSGQQVCLGAFLCGVDGDISIAPNPENGAVLIGGTAETEMPVSAGAFQPTDKAEINTAWAAKLSLPALP